MNSAQWTIPDTVSPHAADAVCAIGSGDKLFTGSGDEGNTFGNGPLIGPTQLLSVLHVMPFQSSGYHSLPLDHSASARVARFRRKLDGTVVGGGVCVNYFEVPISGYRVSNPAGDVVLCDLVTPVSHIPPMAVDTGTPAVGNDLVLVGWGRDGAAAEGGTQPQDARMIETRTIAAANNGENGLVAQILWSGVNPGPNLFDSGGALVRLVGGVWKATGVISTYSAGSAIAWYRNNASLQIPGLYTPSTAPPPDPSTWLRSNDTSIDIATPAGDFSGISTTSVYWRSGKQAGRQKTILCGYDLAGLPRVTAARLVLNLPTGVAGPTNLLVRRLRRAVTNLANWNTYDGVNAWGTVGAADPATDYYATGELNFAIAATVQPGSDLIIEDPLLLAMAQAAQIDGVPLRLMLESPTIDTVIMSPASMEYANPVVRPRLEMSYAAMKAGPPSPLRNRARRGR